MNFKKIRQCMALLLTAALLFKSVPLELILALNSERDFEAQIGADIADELDMTFQEDALPVYLDDAYANDEIDDSIYSVHDDGFNDGEFDVVEETTETTDHQEETEIEPSSENMIASGTVGPDGASWSLDADGVVRVGAGSISSTGIYGQSPWYAYSDSIGEIIFTEPVVATSNLTNLFRNLSYLTSIEGLEYIDTSNVTNMSWMFSGASKLTTLDLSSFDTSNVESMSWMFSGASKLTTLNLSRFDTSNVTTMGSMFLDASDLTTLDLSSFDTGNVTNMSNMFVGASMLQRLVLGSDFSFLVNSGLPSIQATSEFTGYWQNVGSGTVDRPTGDFVFTSAGLMANYDGFTMADTFVRQPVYHTVTFLWNYVGAPGNGIMAKEDVPGDLLIAEPTEPTREGYEFEGWTTDPAGEHAWDFKNDRVIGDVTLYARWAYDMLSAGDMLAPVEETEIYKPVEPRSAPAAHSGLVQFILEPVESSLPVEVTMAQARAAAFNSGTMVHQLFANATTSTVATGVNGRFGRDALFLGQSADGNRFRILMAGFEGYVDRIGPPGTITVPVNGVSRTFDVNLNAVFVPFSNYPSNTNNNTVRQVSHYVNRNGELWRYLTNNVTETGTWSRFLTGPAPDWMSQNTRYYSFDGVFFYRNPTNIRVNGSGAVNANNPYFNYFQYLSFRSSSRVTAAQLNNALTNPSVHSIDTSTSVMRNQGTAFINAQNRYGINALLIFAKGMHESAAGTSSIARDNNNLFGLGAFDGDPAGGAHRFENVADSVNSLADSWLSQGYLWPSDWRSNGPHVGHKGSGMNIRYAMDPYWGQKIGGWAFRIDRSLGNQDVNREQIAIRQNTSTVAVQNAGGATLYTANPRGGRFSPFLVKGTETNNRLRILTDAPIVNGLPNRTALFNRNNAVGFIPNSNAWITGAGNPSTPPTTPQPPLTNHQISGMVQTGVTRRNASFRQGPGANYAEIRVVNGSTNVRITGRSGVWYRVVVGGTTGWMRQSGVARTRQNAVVTMNNAHVRTGRGTSYRSLTRVPRGQRVTVARRSAHWSRITVNGHTGWIRNRDLEAENAMRPGRTIANNVTVHTRPNADANIRRTLPRDTQLMIVQHTTDGWSQVRIRHAGGTLHGWVRRNQVEHRVHSRRLVRNGALRSGPSTNFGRTRTIPNNSSVTVRSRVGNWYHVHFNINGRRQYGWLHQNNLRPLTLPR